MPVVINGVPAAPGTPSLELRDVEKAFGQVLALKRVNLAAYPGELQAIVAYLGRGSSLC